MGEFALHQLCHVFLLRAVAAHQSVVAQLPEVARLTDGFHWILLLVEIVLIGILLVSGIGCIRQFHTPLVDVETIVLGSLLQLCLVPCERHLLCGIVGKGQFAAQLTVEVNVSSAHGYNLVTLGIDDAHLGDAGGDGCLLALVACNDTVVFVEQDAATSTQLAERLLDHFATLLSSLIKIFVIGDDVADIHHLCLFFVFCHVVCFL